jgi:hypothetical protein
LRHLGGTVLQKLLILLALQLPPKLPPLLLTELLVKELGI